MSAIERVMFTQCDCDDMLDMYREDGARALFDHCTQWHYPGEHDTAAELSSLRDRAATHYQFGAYTLSVSTSLGYVSLEYDTLHYEMRRIERLAAVVSASLFGKGSLSYDRMTEALTRLANTIADYDGETESIWYIDPLGCDCLADLIPAAYWHYTEWHAGQFSDTYRALSALGGIYSPNMETVDRDSMTFQQLAIMAQG